MSFTMPYSKLYILTELSDTDKKFISADRQKLDLSIYIYLWYRKFYNCTAVEIQPDSTNIKKTLLRFARIVQNYGDAFSKISSIYYAFEVGTTCYVDVVCFAFVCNEKC